MEEDASQVTTLPPSSITDSGWIWKHMDLSVRGLNCLFLWACPPLEESAGVHELLNMEHVGRIKNLGKKTFAEIVLALLDQAGCSIEEIKGSTFWQTAPHQYQDYASSFIRRLDPRLNC